MAEEPDPTGFATFGANATGPGWAIRILDTAGLPIDFVEGRSGLEGSGRSDTSDLYARISAANLAGGGHDPVRPWGGRTSPR